jgi:hypothetical protein
MVNWIVFWILAIISIVGVALIFWYIDQYVTERVAAARQQ